MWEKQGSRVAGNEVLKLYEKAGINPYTNPVDLRTLQVARQSALNKIKRVAPSAGSGAAASSGAQRHHLLRQGVQTTGLTPRR